MLGDAEETAQLSVPPQRLNVHQHGPAGVGDVSDVHLPSGADQVEQQPGVHGAEAEPLSPRRLGHPGPVVQQPAEAEGREVGGDGEAAKVLQAVLTAGGAGQPGQDGLER